jgi:alkylation response protein AidB-like acyl-CoA dehydrogenase
MSSQPTTQSHSDPTARPCCCPPRCCAATQEALQAARELAEVARHNAARRDQQRKLPWAEIEQFTRSGLGSISIPKAYGGPKCRSRPSPKCSA